MKRYEFYRNQKITVIDCRYFSFEAENLETAVQKIKELCADGQLDELSNDPTYQEDVAYQIPGTEYRKDYSTLISTPCLSGVNWWQCAIPNIQPYMSRLMLEFVSSTKIYRVVQYKTLIVRFLCLFSLSDKSERSIELITRYMDDKSPRKNVVFEGF